MTWRMPDFTRMAPKVREHYRGREQYIKTIRGGRGGVSICVEVLVGDDRFRTDFWVREGATWTLSCGEVDPPNFEALSRDREAEPRPQPPDPPANDDLDFGPDILF